MKRWYAIGLALAISVVLSLTVVGCGGSSDNSSPVSVAPTSDPSAKLVFVVSSDLTHNNGDINPSTANLTNQGLQRALLMARYLRTTLLKSASINGIYTLTPATHLQTANNYPDLVPLEIIHQFAMLNQYTEQLQSPAGDFTANSFPIFMSYTKASLPTGVAPPQFLAPMNGVNFQGLDFADNGGGNEALVNSLLSQNPSATYVFSLPFETLQSLLGNLKASNAYNYAVPASWAGPNVVYVLSVPSVPSGGQPTLTAYDAQVNPGTSYPVLTQPYQSAPNQQAPTVAIQPATMSGSSVPAGMNKNETVYFIRHAEAHPVQQFEDGNMVLQGDWRALYLPAAMKGKIKTPDVIYACDPGTPTEGFPAPNSSAALTVPAGNSTLALQLYSYVRVSQTIAPYAIANSIPFCVPTGFTFGYMPIGGNEDLAAVDKTVNFFFTGGQFNNKTLFVSWEHDHIVEIGQNILNRYFASNPANAPAPPAWASSDYDTIWTFSLDANGQLTFSNQLCEGIDSPSLPNIPPTFRTTP